LRSPHLDEKSQEQFDAHAHKRLVDIFDPTQSTIEALEGLEFPPGVGVEIRKVRTARSDAGVEAGVAFGQPSTDIDLVERGLAVIGSPEKLARWMQTPIPALGGQTPYSLLGSEEGRKQVATVLGRIEHGIYRRDRPTPHPYPLDHRVRFAGSALVRKDAHKNFWSRSLF